MASFKTHTHDVDQKSTFSDFFNGQMGLIAYGSVALNIGSTEMLQNGLCGDKGHGKIGRLHEKVTDHFRGDF